MNLDPEIINLLTDLPWEVVCRMASHSVICIGNDWPTVQGWEVCLHGEKRREDDASILFDWTLPVDNDAIRRTIHEVIQDDGIALLESCGSILDAEGNYKALFQVQLAAKTEDGYERVGPAFESKYCSGALLRALHWAIAKLTSTQEEE